MKKSTVWIAAFAVVLCAAAFAAAAATVTPRSELIVNGNFEAGADIPRVLTALTMHTFPGGRCKTA